MQTRCLPMAIKVKVIKNQKLAIIFTNVGILFIILVPLRTFQNKLFVNILYRLIQLN